VIGHHPDRPRPARSERHSAEEIAGRAVEEAERGVLWIEHEGSPEGRVDQQRRGVARHRIDSDRAVAGAESQRQYGGRDQRDEQHRNSLAIHNPPPLLGASVTSSVAHGAAIGAARMPAMRFLGYMGTPSLT